MNKKADLVPRLAAIRIEKVQYFGESPQIGKFKKMRRCPAPHLPRYRLHAPLFVVAVLAFWARASCAMQIFKHWSDRHPCIAIQKPVWPFALTKVRKHPDNF